MDTGGELPRVDRLGEEVVGARPLRVVERVEVALRDNDTPGLYVTEVAPGTNTEDRRTLVIEGTDTTELRDEILDHLTRIDLRCATWLAASCQRHSAYDVLPQLTVPLLIMAAIPFSLVGIRGDCDLMLLSQAVSLEHSHEFHVVLAQSGLMSWSTIPYSYLGATKPSEYSDETRLEVRDSRAKYTVVYPFVKKREWYGLDPKERWRIMQDHIAIGKRYPNVDNNTTYCFGLDDQEFVVAFDTDDPLEFLDLVQELRPSEASAWTERDTPSFTCLAASVERALGALDGEPLIAHVSALESQT